MSEPIPYCLECDEPLNWRIHGDGSGWAETDVPELRSSICSEHRTPRPGCRLCLIRIPGDA